MEFIEPLSLHSNSAGLLSPLVCPCSQTRNFLLLIWCVMMNLMPLQKSVRPAKIMFLFHLKVYIVFHSSWFASSFIFRYSLDHYDYCCILVH